MAIWHSMLVEYGLLFLFFVAILEGANLLYFAPSESLVPTAILFLGSDFFTITTIVSVSVLGATLGQLLLFFISKRKGRKVIMNNRFYRIKESRMNWFEDIFQKYGAIAVPITNSMLFLRGTMTIPAGISKMSSNRFLVLSFAGTLIFKCALAALTIYFSPNHILEI